MTPKEKALELVDKMSIGKSYESVTDEMWGLVANNKYRHLCAIKAVDEILEALKSFEITFNYILTRDYWLEVKQEIKKL